MRISYNVFTKQPGGGLGNRMNESKELLNIGFAKKKVYSDELTRFLYEIKRRHPDQQVTFLCIGTDRSTGDALGPLVGSRLEELGIKEVVGTLRLPCDAENLEARMAEISSEPIIVAIDACLGMPTSVGSYLVSEEPLFPAKSVGRNLPAVGHYSIAAVVNVNGTNPYRTLQMTSLYKVMQMADEIAVAIAAVFFTTE